MADYCYWIVKTRPLNYTADEFLYLEEHDLNGLTWTRLREDALRFSSRESARMAAGPWHIIVRVRVRCLSPVPSPTLLSLKRDHEILKAMHEAYKIENERLCKENAELRAIVLQVVKACDDSPYVKVSDDD